VHLWRSHRSGLGRALVVLALLAMAVRAVVPAGFMLAPSHNGDLLTVTLCSGHGPVEALMDLKTGAITPKDGDHTPKKSTAADAPCVFAAVAPLATPAQPPTLIVHSVMVSVAPARARTMRPGLGLAAPPPWATGPPLNA
jgi:hypothetical protein